MAGSCCTFDDGRRPVSLLANGVRVHHTVYGDTLQTPPANSLGRPVEVWDTAGRLAFTYDFKGRPLTETRRVLADITVDADWDTLDAQLLDAEDFTVATTYDALDRPTSQTAPDGAVTTPSYDAGGRLVAVEVDSTPVVTSITYDARGQRLGIVYGNHTSTAYTYDPERFWLTRLHTTRSGSSSHGAATLQDLTYTRDLVGNLTSIADDAQETVYFANTQVSATRAFVHDSLYRLVQATGREKDGLTQTTHELPSMGGLPDSGNPALRRYTQSYEYDEVGNLLEMKHQLGSGGSVLWKRDYTYASGSNRLLTTSMGQTSLSYDYDARGALSNLPHLEGFTRDFRDQLRKVVLDLSGNEAWYAHDGAGQRVRKFVDKGAVTEERIYVGGWEVWRKRVNGTLDEERTTLHVRDGERRVAMVETKTVVDEEPVTSPVPRWRFQLDDHLGSAVSECDDEGGVFSYEELHPYGSVAWSAVDSALDVSPRRYRYTGMERDEETGLQAHGVRMYAPWLGRWDRPDPIGLGDGVNRWGYVHGGPVRGRDASGLADEGPLVLDDFTTRSHTARASAEQHEGLKAANVVSRGLEPPPERRLSELRLEVQASGSPPPLAGMRPRSQTASGPSQEEIERAERVKAETTATIDAWLNTGAPREVGAGLYADSGGRLRIGEARPLEAVGVVDRGDRLALPHAFPHKALAKEASRREDLVGFLHSHPYEHVERGREVGVRLSGADVVAAAHIALKNKSGVGIAAAFVPAGEKASAFDVAFVTVPDRQTAQRIVDNAASLTGDTPSDAILDALGVVRGEVFVPVNMPVLARVSTK